MEILTNIIQEILNIGAIAFLPIIVTVLGLIFRMKFFEAFKSGLLFGIGFQGLKLVISLLTTTIQPIIDYYAGSGASHSFTTIDVGWQTLSAAAWTSPFAAVVIPGGVILNFVLIKAKVIKTLNIDIWNYWHILMSASILYYILGNAGITGAPAVIISFVFAMALMVFINFVGDKIAPWWQEYFGYEGTTCTTKSSTLAAIPVVFVTNKVLDKIPHVNKININLSWINKKLGVLGDPAIVGFIVGLFMAVITLQTPAVMIQVAVGISAVIVLLPRMVSLFMEGLAPVSKAAKQFVVKHLGEDREILLGCDSAFGLGDPAVITLGLLLIPITIAIAFIIPGNTYFPVGILASIPYYAGMTCMISKGNLFRGLVNGTIFMVLLVLSMNFMADIATTFISAAGVMEIAEGTKVTGASLANIVDILVVGIAKLFGAA